MNYTKHSKKTLLDSKVDFTVYDYTQELAGLFNSLSTVHRKVDFFIYGLRLRCVNLPLVQTL